MNIVLVKFHWNLLDGVHADVKERGFWAAH